jgi:hypothetical protein
MDWAAGIGIPAALALVSPFHAEGWGMKGFISGVIASAAIALLAAPAFAAGPFADWAAIVVAGDWHAHDGNPSEVFDNARRDISSDLVRLGFQPGNVEQFSVRPENYPQDRASASDAHTIATSLWDLSNRTSAGCLIYFTSHGSTDGILMGSDTYAPGSLSQMLDNTCSDRPTVVIISACFSGVFVPALQAPNRMILTAARPDRTSFGCSQSLRYTFFDQCFLETLPATSDFPDLGRGVQACVAAREKREHVAPASEPQLWVGATAQTSLPRWR